MALTSEVAWRDRTCQQHPEDEDPPHEGRRQQQQQQPGGEGGPGAEGAGKGQPHGGEHEVRMATVGPAGQVGGGGR